MRAWCFLALLACGRPESSSAPTCTDPPRGPAMTQLENVTGSTGIDFVYSASGFQGGGLGIGDIDNDGLADIVAARRDDGLAVFVNRGSLRFERASAWGLDEARGARAIAIADLDNDGYRDLVVAGAGVAYVMANDGQTFRDVARFDDTGMTEHVLASDLDADGFVDLYFGNYDIRSAANTENRLYMNRGAFAFASTRIGGGLTWTTTAFDVDADGDQDLYVANDTLLYDFGKGATLPPDPGLIVDQLFRNDGVGADGFPRLTDIAADVGLAAPRSSMGGLVGDLDDDGQLDLYVPDFGAKKLFVRGGGGGFVDRAPELGVAATRRENPSCGADALSQACLLLSWSAALSDFDLDGNDELVVVNGETSPEDRPPVLVLSRGTDGTYHERSSDLGCLDARALVVTDLDGDGDQDVAIANKEGPLEIYEVRGRPTQGTWHRITLRGRTANRDGIGAIVTLRTASGRTRTRVVGAGGTVHSTSPAEAFFGVGADRASQLDVLWPSGRRTTMPGPLAGSVVIDEDQ